MIDVKNKIVIFDNVKTGSTSLRSILSSSDFKKSKFNFSGKHTKITNSSYEYFNSDGDSKVFICKKTFDNYLKDKSINRKLKSEAIFIEKEELISNYFKVATIRNPYDRILSLFRHRLKKGSRCLVNKYSLDLNDFEKYLKKIYNKIEFEGYNSEPLSSIIKIDNNQLLNLDFKIRFENYSSDIIQFFKHIGFDIKNIPHEKKTNSFNFKNFYTKRSKAIVEEIYKLDFEHFDYERF